MSFKSVSYGIRQIRQHSAVMRIKGSGGIVGFEHEWDAERDCLSKRKPPGPRFLRYLLGDDFFASARLVIFSEMPVSVRELEDLLYLKDLNKLGIVDCTIANGAGSVLSDLPQLSFLSLCGTSIDESDILELNALENLEGLVVTATGLSQSAIERLQVLLPRCRIYYEPGESVPISQILRSYTM